VALRRFSTINPFVASEARRRALVANAGNLLSLEEPLRIARERGLSLVHLHTAGRIGGGVRAALRWSGRPYVLSAHGPLLSSPELLGEETARRHARTLDLGRPFGALVGARRVLDDAAAVLSFNDDEHRALQLRVGDRAVRTDHGVDVARCSSGDARRADARWPALAGRPVVLVLGRLSRQKNQVFAVRAFAAGAPTNAALALAGSETDPGYRAEVEREARALGVAERVFLLGNVDPEVGVPDLLARADLLLAPSTHEAFGLVVLEAWAARVPALFARNTGLADLARRLPDASVALPSGELAAWASALRARLDDPARRAREAGEGHALVQRAFRWDHAVAQLERVYERALEGARARRVAT